MTLATKLQKYARDIKTLPNDLRVMYRRGGWSDAWQTLRERTVQRVFRSGRYFVVMQTLDEVRDVPPPEGITLRRFEDRDWPALATIAAQRDLDRFRRFIADGHVCILAWRGERVVGYTWYGTQIGPGVTLLPLPMPPHGAYLWEVYVPVAERSSGIGSALVAARLRMARDDGFREGWRMIAPSNAPSLRTVGKTSTTGASHIVGEITYIKIFSWLRAWYKPRQDTPARPG